MRKIAHLVALLAVVLFATVMTATVQAVVPAQQLIPADVETVPVTHSGDSADDPAIWVNKANPGESLVIGNDKHGALETYNLDGSLHQRVTTAKAFWGNVDVRQNVNVGTRTFDVVAVYNGGLRLYGVNATTRNLKLITDGTGAYKTGGGEGLCLYVSPHTGDLSAFLIKQSGLLRQYRISDADNDGLLEATMTRKLSIGSESEGCVADDATGALYVSEEDVALWRYGAEPTDGTTRTVIDKVQPTGYLSADIEGLTLVQTSSTGGYLIASAQDVAHPQQSYFTVYDRKSGAYQKAFRVVTGPKVDGCERTDGVAAYAGNLGPSFPYGLFVCQDNNNRVPYAGNQDFKLVRLDKIVNVGG